MAATKNTKPKTTTTTTTITKITKTTNGSSRRTNNSGFSWSRLIGLTGLKSKISRKTGVPLTKAGRDRKIGAMITKGISSLFSGGKGGKKPGCLGFILLPTAIIAGIYYLI